MTRFDMKFLILLLLNGYTILTVDTATPESTRIASKESNYELPTNIQLISYIIKLTVIDTEDYFTFNGYARIVIRVHNRTSDIVFHNHGLTLHMNESFLLDHVSKLVYSIQRLKNYQQDNETQTTVMTFGIELFPKNYILILVYSGKLSYDDGVILRFTDTRDTELKWLVAMQFKKNAARRLFPCWDDPTHNGVFDISIKHHRSINVISNMQVRMQESPEPEMIWTHFESTPIIPTYLITLAITNIDRATNSSIPSIWGRQNIGPQLAFATRVTDHIKRQLNEYTKMELLAETNLNFVLMPGEFKPIRSWGLVIFR